MPKLAKDVVVTEVREKVTRALQRNHLVPNRPRLPSGEMSVNSMLATLKTLNGPVRPSPKRPPSAPQAEPEPVARAHKTPSPRRNALQCNISGTQGDRPAHHSERGQGDPRLPAQGDPMTSPRPMSAQTRGPPPGRHVPKGCLLVQLSAISLASTAQQSMRNKTECKRWNALEAPAREASMRHHRSLLQVSLLRSPVSSASTCTAGQDDVDCS